MADDDTSTNAAANTPTGSTEVEQPLCQWIVLRKDLIKTLNWPLGAIVAQGSHASVAALHTFASDENVKQYLENLDSMHKVVLEAKNQNQLQTAANNLKEANLDFKLWIEQPEGIPTALATKPYRKVDIGSIFRKLQLLR